MNENDRVTEIAGRVAARAEISLEEWQSSSAGDVVCAQSRSDILDLLDRLRTAEAERDQARSSVELHATALRLVGIDRNVAEVRAAEAEAELVTVKMQRSDNLQAIAERDAVISEASALAPWAFGMEEV